jgi:hypothetical protein
MVMIDRGGFGEGVADWGGLERRSRSTSQGKLSQLVEQHVSMLGVARWNIYIVYGLFGQDEVCMFGNRWNKGSSVRCP